MAAHRRGAAGVDSGAQKGELMEPSIRLALRLAALGCAIVLVAVGASAFSNQQSELVSAGSTAAPSNAALAMLGLHGIPNDWSHHHLIFSHPGSAALAARLGHDPRYQIQRSWRSLQARPGTAEAYMQSLDALALRLSTAGLPNKKGKPNALTGDWSVSMDSTATVGAGRYPAKYSFSPIGTPNCTNDFVVFNTGMTGTMSQASIIAFNNLYSGSISNGGCGTSGVPAVYWAYNTGGKITNSVVLSSNGSQIAFIHSATSGASLVILKWLSGQGTSAPSPQSSGANFVTTTSTSTFATCKGVATDACQLSLTFSNNKNSTRSAPFYDYANDIIYVGDDGGNIHKFTGVFNGTPAEAGAPWPVAVNNNSLIAGPVLDSEGTPPALYMSLNLQGGSGGLLAYFALPSPSSTATPAITISKGIGTASVDIADSPVVDSTSGHIYVVVSTDTGGHSGFFSFARGFGENTSGTEAIIGTGSAGPGGSVQPLYDGDFDNTYYSSSIGTGKLYVCGNAAGNPSLYQVVVTGGSPSTNSSANNPVTLVNTGGSTSNPACSPVTEIYNFGATGGPFDWIFLSVQNFGAPSACSSGGCVMSFIVTEWTASIAYSLNQEVLDTNLNIQKVTTAGTSGASQPSWNTSSGGMTTDGSSLDERGVDGVQHEQLVRGRSGRDQRNNHRQYVRNGGSFANLFLDPDQHELQDRRRRGMRGAGGAVGAGPMTFRFLASSWYIANEIARRSGQCAECHISPSACATWRSRCAFIAIS
jgi:hypothetical protein